MHELGLEIIHGRAVAAIINLGMDVVLISAYFHSGVSAADQLPMWRDITQLSLPFIVGGDVQTPPEEVRDTRLLEMLGAKIVAPAGCTNTKSLRKIDSRPTVEVRQGYIADSNR